MIYRAYAGGKEITGFRIGDKSASEIWGGDTLLWKNNNRNLLAAEFYCTYPSNVFWSSTGLKTQYMEELVFHYNMHVYVKCSPIIHPDESMYKYSWVYYYKYLSIGVLEFQLLIKASDVFETEIYKYVSNDTRVNTNEKPKKVVLQHYNLAKTTDGIYTINGTYTPILFDEKDLSGNYLVEKFGRRSFSHGVWGDGLLKSFTDMGEAIDYLKNF